MNKEKYTRPEMQITEIEAVDVLTTSAPIPELEENELIILK